MSTKDDVKALQALLLNDNATNDISPADDRGAHDLTLDNINALVKEEFASDPLTNTYISDNAITTSKIVDTGVTEDKLATSAVSSAKIKAANVQTAAIKDLNVTLGKLSQPVQDLLLAVGGGTITNNPDDEDLESVTSQLKFKDRTNSGNQLGRKIIRAGFDFTAIHAGYDNAIWVIQYEHDLGGNPWVIPTGVILENDGGFISNYGVITVNETTIKSERVKFFDNSGSFSDSFTNSEYYPEWFGAVGGGIIDDTAAIDTAASLGVCVLGFKEYLYTNTDNRIDNFCIRGVKMPVLNDTETGLMGGSIIVGTLLLKGRDPQVYNMGVDHGLDKFPSIQGNALALAAENPFIEESSVFIQNVVALCAGVEDPYHAILVEGHYDVNIDNVMGVKSFFGCAMKNTRNNISNAIFKYNGSDNLIIKSDTVSGKVEKVNVNNIICVGSGTSGGETTSFSVRVSAFDNDIEDVNISNVITTGASYSVYLDASAVDAGVMKRVHVSGLSGSDMGRVVLMDGGGGTGLIDRISIDTVDVDEVEFRPFEAKGNIGEVTVNNFKTSNILGATLLSSAMQILSTVDRVNLSNIELTENNDVNSLGTVNLANSYIGNSISGNNKFNLAGVGAPRPGYSVDSSTGTSIILTPDYESKNKSIIELSGSGTRTVISILRDMPSLTRFPYNYELTIINNASGTVTMQHNPGGFIYNRGSANFNIAPSEVVKYVFFNSVWHQV